MWKIGTVRGILESATGRTDSGGRNTYESTQGDELVLEGSNEGPITFYKRFPWSNDDDILSINFEIPQRLIPFSNHWGISIPTLCIYAADMAV